MTTIENHTPTFLPPAAASGAAATQSAPTLDQPAAPPAAGTISDGRPTLVAPQPAVGDGVGAATWRSGQVTATWAIDEVRNAWIQVSGVGWRKLYNGHDGSFTALLALAAQSRQTGQTIQFREEADGMIYEIYLW